MKVQELVQHLGGPSVVAKALDVSSEAVCNWYSRGIPRGRHLQLWQLAQAAGIEWQPPQTEGLTLAPALSAIAA
jgi:hypothetical protein